MGCSSCGGGPATAQTYQVRDTDNTVTRYATEAEARIAADVSGGAFEVVRR